MLLRIFRFYTCIILVEVIQLCLKYTNKINLYVFNLTQLCNVIY